MQTYCTPYDHCKMLNLFKHYSGIIKTLWSALVAKWLQPWPHNCCVLGLSLAGDICFISPVFLFPGFLPAFLILISKKKKRKKSPETLKKMKKKSTSISTEIHFVKSFMY